MYSRNLTPARCRGSAVGARQNCNYRKHCNRSDSLAVLGLLPGLIIGKERNRLLACLYVPVIAITEVAKCRANCGGTGAGGLES